MTLPDEAMLAQNYPNPFNPETTILYQLAKRAAVRLQVYDITGQKVATLVDENQVAGSQKVSCNAADDLGQSVLSGIYRYRLQVNNLVLMNKMMVIQ